MSNIYDSARIRLLKADLNWLTLELVVVAWKGTPDFDPTDDEVQDILARGKVTKLGESMPVHNTMVSPDGSAQTDQIVIPAIEIGESVTWLTLCERHPNPDLYKLILSTDDATDLPFDPNGLDIIVQPDWLTMRGWFRP